MSDPSLTVLVTGATGIIGNELVHLLASNPAVGEVRAGTRHPERGGANLLVAMNPDVVRPVTFDDGDPESLADAFEDVDVLCLIVPLMEDMAGWQDRVLAHARGVRRVVKVSVDAAREGTEIGTIAGDHWHGEELVRGLGAEHSIVRPTLFMQHFMLVPGLYEPGDDTFYLPIGDASVAMLDARDIAAVVATLSTADAAGLPSEPFIITGPEALTGEELRDRLSWAVGREIRWNRDPEAFASHSDAVGSPKEVAAIYEAGAECSFSQTQTSDFEDIVGRRPRSFARFASDYAHLFRPVAAA